MARGPRLFPVDGARARQEELANAASASELECVPRTGNDCVQHRKRIQTGKTGARFRRGVDHDGEFPFRKLEAADMAPEQTQSAVTGQVRRLAGKALGIASHRRGRGVRPEPVVGPQETIHEPATEEAGAAGEKQVVSTQLRPQFARVRENEVEVVCG